MDEKIKDMDVKATKQNNESNRRPYRQPKLIKYGDIRSLTLGGSPGNGDTGPGGGSENEVALDTAEESEEE